MRTSVGILIVAVAGLTLSCTRSAQDQHSGNASEVSALKATPAIELADADGTVYRLSDYLGTKPFILWFTNLCPGCQAAIPTLDSVYSRLLRQHTELLAVSQLGEDRETVIKAAKTLRFSFPVLLDPTGVVCKRFVGEYVPGTCPLSNLFVFDRTGTIRYQTHYPGSGLDKLVLLATEAAGK